MVALYAKKPLVAKNETRWNSQLKTIRRIVEVDVDKVVEKRELSVTQGGTQGGAQGASAPPSEKKVVVQLD